ncbi:DNA-directed RNA polymerase i subunit rpa34 [Anaeramoeba flamelloides]|uniref:DNA-directed RNA polymerase i subunit rpa34 n=1 Tax=Anaeramoeba flamelloides TaxID=1746091 RepID=A0ABQ8YU57_9EUKA|nr:DNA-directed RNA polymerase i subunit rpa34 [Anaeramoeba flamelloides]
MFYFHFLKSDPKRTKTTRKNKKSSNTISKVVDRLPKKQKKILKKITEIVEPKKKISKEERLVQAIGESLKPFKFDFYLLERFLYWSSPSTFIVLFVSLQLFFLVLSQSPGNRIEKIFCTIAIYFCLRCVDFGGAKQILLTIISQTERPEKKYKKKPDKRFSFTENTCAKKKKKKIQIHKNNPDNNNNNNDKNSLSNGSQLKNKGAYLNQNNPNSSNINSQESKRNKMKRNLQSTNNLNQQVKTSKKLKKRRSEGALINKHGANSGSKSAKSENNHSDLNIDDIANEILSDFSESESERLSHSKDFEEKHDTKEQIINRHVKDDIRKKQENNFGVQTISNNYDDQNMHKRKTEKRNRRNSVDSFSNLTSENTKKEKDQSIKSEKNNKRSKVQKRRKKKKMKKNKKDHAKKGEEAINKKYECKYITIDKVSRFISSWYYFIKLLVISTFEMFKSKSKTINLFNIFVLSITFKMIPYLNLFKTLWVITDIILIIPGVWINWDKFTFFFEKFIFHFLKFVKNLKIENKNK